MRKFEFEVELKKLGLSEKEASVYIATLHLGSGSVQQIARKAKIARATTYLVLDSLLEYGLVTKLSQGGRTLFIAESPHQLKRILKIREQELEKKKEDLGNLLPELLAVAQRSDDRPTVRYYEGLEGLRAARSEMLRETKPGEFWYQLSPVDHMIKVLGEENSSYAKERQVKGIKSKSIITTSSSHLKTQLLKASNKTWLERRYVSPSQYTSTSGFTIYRNRVSIGVFEGNIGGIIIESKSIATMMREIFEILWKNAKSS